MKTALPAPAEAQPLVDIDLPCVGCDYNLRTQPRDGHCPECAQPVAESLSGFILQGADPAWCRGTARGLYFLSWIMLLIPLQLLYHWIVFPIVQNPPPNFAVLLASVLQGGHHIENLLLAIGLWWITRPDPNSPEQHRILRRSIRTISLLFWVCCLPGVVGYIWMLSGYSRNVQAPFPDMLHQVNQIIVWPRTIGKLMLFSLLLTLLWCWLSRTRHPRLERWFSTIYWVFLGIAAVLLLNFFVSSWLLATLSRGSPLDPQTWLLLRQIGFIGNLLWLVLIMGLFFATRMAAVAMLKPPANHDDNRSSRYRTIFS